MTRRPRQSVAQKTPIASKRAASEASLPVNRQWLGAILIALFAIVLYIPGFSNGFVYDAQVAVEQDTRIHTLAHPLQLLTSSYWAFDQERLALYRPLVTLSYAIDWAVHGGNPSGFRSNQRNSACADRGTRVSAAGQLDPDSRSVCRGRTLCGAPAQHGGSGEHCRTCRHLCGRFQHCRVTCLEARSGAQQKTRCWWCLCCICLR